MALLAKKPSGTAGGPRGAALTSFFFPSDIVPDDPELLEKWMHQYADAIYRYGLLCLDNNDVENYQYAQGKVPIENFDHVTKLYQGTKTGRAMPARIRQVNSIARTLNDFIGNVDGQNIGFSVSVTNESALTEKLDHFVDHMTEQLTMVARASEGTSELLGRPLKDGDNMPMDIQGKIKQLQEENLTTWQQDNEINVSKGLKYCLEDKKMNLKFNLSHHGLYNYAITKKIAFDTGVRYGMPYAEPIDTRLIVYDLESVSNFIQKGRFAGYYFAVSPQEVKDRCENLSEDDLLKINSMTHLFGNGDLGKSPFWYTHNTFRNLYFNGLKCYWKGLKKVWVKVSPNLVDEDNPHVHFVDKDEVDKWNQKKKKIIDRGDKPDESVYFEQRYYNTIFECTYIAGSIYYQCREVPDQFINDEEPSERELPIIGAVDDVPCLVDLLKPLEDMRIECFYTLERLLTQVSGKVLIVDEAIEEDSQENLYNMMAFRVYKINTAKEAEMQTRNQPMMPKEVDLGLSEAVTQIMRLLAFLDQNMATIVGSNEAAQGTVKSDQGLGITQMAVQSAQRAIQPYYSFYYTVVEQVLQRVCDLMRPAWAGREMKKMWMGDKMAEFFNLSPDTDWHLARYGVFVHNNVKSDADRKMMIGMAQQLLPVNKDPNLALAVINMVQADSAAEAKKIFKEGVEAMNRINEEMRKEQAMQAQQMAMATQQAAKTKADADMYKADSQVKSTNITAEAMKEVAGIKMGHEMNKETVAYQNELTAQLAKHLLTKDQQMDMFEQQQALAEQQQAADAQNQQQPAQ